jgi:hypothetical protein
MAMSALQKPKTPREPPSLLDIVLTFVYRVVGMTIPFNFEGGSVDLVGVE